MKKIVFIMILCVYSVGAREPSFSENMASLLKQELPSYFLTGNSALSPEMKSYLEFFELPISQINYRYGYISTPHGKIFLQSFEPHSFTGTIIVSHGYLEHSAWTGNLVKYFLSKNYKMVIFDHYGHGFSEGIPGHIDDFKKYGVSLKHVIKTIQPYVQNKPLYAVGHSMGGATILQYTLNTPDHPLDAVILAAPLVRSYMWTPSTIAARAAHQMIERVPRMYSYNDDLMPRGKADPLQVDTMPLSWVEALVRWNRENPRFAKSSVPLLVLQGGKDNVVDNSYNQEYIQEHFRNSNFILYPESGHLLFNESQEIQKKVFQRILSFIRKQENRADDR